MVAGANVATIIIMLLVGFSDYDYFFAVSKRLGQHHQIALTDSVHALHEVLQLG